MKLYTKQDEIFLEQAKMGFYDFQLKYFKKGTKNSKLDILLKRAHRLNRKFQFTPLNIQRLDEINKHLAVKEMDAHIQAKKLEEYAVAEMNKENPFVIDYEINFEFSLYAPNKYKDIEKMDAFYTDKYGMRFWKKGNTDAAFFENWELNENHNVMHFEDNPLKGQHHCYLFHHLYDHCWALSWQDIVDIEIIWIDVMLIVQNSSSL